MSPDPSRPPSRAFSCLVKGPLGCSAFLLGAAGVFVLLFPPVGGRLADRWVEDWFAQRHAGRLELGDAWVGSLYGRQSVERVILRDPAGEEVLRGTLTAPPLSWILEGRRPYGPIDLCIENLHVVLGADGLTNLDRALGHGSILPTGLRSDRVRTDVPLEASVRVDVERLRLDGPGTVTETLSGLHLEGRLEWTPETLRFSLSGGESDQHWAAFAFELELERTMVGDGRSSAKWTLVNVPVVLAGIGASPVAQLAPLAGARIDRVEGLRREGELELLAHDEGLDLAVHAHYRNDPPALVGAGLREGIELEVGPSDLSILRPFLPFVGRVESAGARLRLTDFEWSLDSRPGDLSGALEIELEASAYEFDAALGLPEGAPDVLHPAPGRLDRKLILEGGRLSFQGVELPLRDGALVLDGTSDLVGTAFDLGVRAEVGAGPLDLGRFEGPHAVLPPSAPRAPEVAPARVEPEPTPRGGQD